MNGLDGKIIISTQPEPEKLASVLKFRKAKFFSFPTIKIVPERINNAVSDVMQNLNIVDILIFTSKNGVRYFFKFLKEITHSALPQTLKCYVIGNSTASELRKFGVEPAFISSGNTSRDFFSEIEHKPEIKGKNILLALGSLAENYLQEKLQTYATTKRIDVYKTILPENFEQTVFQRILKTEYDWIFFTSPSGFENFLHIFRNEKPSFGKFAAIGQITADFIVNKGFKVEAVAQKSSPEGMVEAIENYYKGI